MKKRFQSIINYGALTLRQHNAFTLTCKTHLRHFEIASYSLQMSRRNTQAHCGTTTEGPPVWMVAVDGSGGLLGSDRFCDRCRVRAVHKLDDGGQFRAHAAHDVGDGSMSLRAQREALALKWLRNGGQLRLRQMRQRSNCVRWCRIHHRQGGQ